MKKTLLKTVSIGTLTLVVYQGTALAVTSPPIAPIQNIITNPTAPIQNLIPGIGNTSVITAPTQVQCESQNSANSSVLAFTPLAQNLTQPTNVGGTVNNIVSFFTDMVDGLIENFNISNVVNIHELFNDIMSGELPSESELANAIENNLPNSFSQRKDYAETIQRKAAIATIQDTTLGQLAQEKTLDNCLYVTEATNNVYNLGQESLTLDTSQQILQNISAQLGQSASVDQIMKEEYTRVRQDLALSSVLQSQIAEQLHQDNITKRRAAIASKNLETFHSGSLTLPGGVW